MTNAGLLNRGICKSEAASRLSVFDFVIILQGLICLSTLFTEANPFSSLINRGLIGVYFFLLFLSMIKKNSLKTILTLLMLFFVVAFDLLITNEGIHSLNDVLYLPLWIANLISFTNNFREYKQAIVRRNRFSVFVIFAWNIVVFLSFFLKSSYRVLDGVTSFVSFCGTEHRFAGTAMFCLVYGFISYLIVGKKKYFGLLILPLLSVFLTNARSYIIISIALALYFFLRTARNKMTRYAVFALGILALLAGAYYSTQKKFGQGSADYQIATKGLMYLITSGRNVFWKIDIEQAFSSPTFRVFFGNGYNFVYNVNATYYGASIWAHNDYINVLCANGLVGLFLYFFAFFSMTRKLHRQRKPLYFAIFLFIIFFNAMFNMVYSYTMANVLTPVMCVLMLDKTSFVTETRPCGAPSRTYIRKTLRGSFKW